MTAIKIKQGETYRKRIEMMYADDREPVDLTGYSAYSELRDRPGGTLVATADCSISAVDGVVTVLLSSAQTDAIEEGVYGMDVWIVSEEEKHPIYTNSVQIVKRYTNNLGDAND